MLANFHHVKPLQKSEGKEKNELASLIILTDRRYSILDERWQAVGQGETVGASKCSKMLTLVAPNCEIRIARGDVPDVARSKAKARLTAFW